MLEDSTASWTSTSSLFPRPPPFFPVPRYFGTPGQLFSAFGPQLLSGLDYLGVNSGKLGPFSLYQFANHSTLWLEPFPFTAVNERSHFRPSRTHSVHFLEEIPTTQHSLPERAQGLHGYRTVFAGLIACTKSCRRLVKESGLEMR